MLSTFRGYGPELKFHRRLMQGYMNAELARDQIEVVETIEARRLLVRLLRDPNRFLQHARTYVPASE